MALDLACLPMVDARSSVAAVQKVAQSFLLSYSVSVKIPCLNKRPQFTNVARFGKKFVSESFILQAIESQESKEAGVGRFGFIVTKKNGKAVDRNLIKRRFKSIVHKHLKDKSAPPLDYVVIARPGCIDHKYQDIEKRFENAFHFFTKIYKKSDTHEK